MVRWVQPICPLCGPSLKAQRKGWKKVNSGRTAIGQLEGKEKRESLTTYPAIPGSGVLRQPYLFRRLGASADATSVEGLVLIMESPSGACRST
ncbi:hypothetical protein Tco_1569734 [Tanacetum coccineum]